MTKRLVIVDDEQAARMKLRQLLVGFPDWLVIAELNSGRALLETLDKSSIDVILLDINMPGMNGIEVLTTLNAQGFTGEVIFTTAHSRYAVDAFTEAAADYLLKPLDTNRLQLALERAAQKLKIKQLQQAQQELISHVGQRARPLKVEIIDAIVIQDGMQIAHSGSQTYPLAHTLKELESQLPPHFLRVHRGAIVNRYQLSEVERWLNGRLLLRFLHSNLEVLTSRNGARELKRHLKM
ncbi:LytR/AlgR family response regulator transcription factor [Pseudidiomarina sp.]|uniref:LytR/AlgR family response regulator transcription factor n=1 Tax=Pseudidiomarina sp. TaxID=2081707 RepID=UPI003A9818D5